MAVSSREAIKLTRSITLACKTTSPNVTIRRAKSTDYDQVWEIFSAVIKTGDTYVFNPLTPKEDLAKHWFADYMATLW